MNRAKTIFLIFFFASCAVFALDSAYAVFVAVKAAQFSVGADFFSAPPLNFSYGVAAVNGALIVAAAVYLTGRFAAQARRKKYIDAVTAQNDTGE
ncbi:MAG: hypothetical protein LBC13_00845 [Clostridiales bacterium]|jgi:hypothetical protein|nr:hypothetical protein [Clostridiales bacterium]